MTSEIISIRLKNSFPPPISNIKVRLIFLSRSVDSTYTLTQPITIPHLVTNHTGPFLIFVLDLLADEIFNFFSSF